MDEQRFTASQYLRLVEAFSAVMSVAEAHELASALVAEWERRHNRG